MNAGQEIIQWLYREQLQVEDAWAIDYPEGFTWWPADHPQSVRILREYDGPDGTKGYTVMVRTGFLKDLELDEKTGAILNETIMRHPSVALPVYDNDTGSMTLCSAANVHAGNVQWLRRVLSMVALIQIHEARTWSTPVATRVDAKPDTTPHPNAGPRTEPHALVNGALNLIRAAADRPHAFDGREVLAVHDSLMQRPPALMANADASGATVEFPFGDASSLCEIDVRYEHRDYGTGLLVRQSFPAPESSLGAGANMVLGLSEGELANTPPPYAFGAYHYESGVIRFKSFLPAAVCMPGLLANVYLSCAARARTYSSLLTGNDWTSSQKGPGQSAIGRLFDWLKGE